MTGEILATLQVATEHAGSGGAPMLAALAVPALVALGVIRWRRKRARTERPLEGRDRER